MPYQVNNTFRPASQFGAPIQALTRAMFGGATPEEREAKLAAAEAQRAHAGYYGAQSDLARQQIAEKQAAQTAMQDAPRRFAASIFGSDPKAKEYVDYRSGVQVPTLGAGQTGGMDGGGGDGPAYAPAPMQKPAFVTPEAEERYNTFEGARGLAGMSPGNDPVGGLVKALEMLTKQGQERAVIAGTMNPTRLAQARVAAEGKHVPYSQNAEGSVLNNLEGTVDQSNPLAIAVQNLKKEQAGKETAHAGAYRDQGTASRAAAGASNALAADRRVQTTQRGGMTTWTDPDTNITYNVPETAVATERIKVAGRKEVEGEKAALKPEKGAKPGKVRSTVDSDLKGMASQLEVVLQSDYKLNGVSDDAKKAILAAASDEWQNGASDYGTAVRDAMRKVVPQGFEDERAGIPLVPSKFVPVGGARSPNPNARQIAPPPVKITGDADYAKLPSGTQYIAPDGTTRTKK